MIDFNVFLEGTKETSVVKYVASDRFKQDGKPVEWELKAIDSDLDERIRKDCTRKIKGGRGGVSGVEVDTDKYSLMICVATIVEPQLSNAEFQDAMGVKSAEALLRKLLLPGELIALKEKVMEVNGYDMSMEDLVEEAKN